MTAQQTTEYKAKRAKIISLLREMFPNYKNVGLNSYLKKDLNKIGIKEKKIHDDGCRLLASNIYLNNVLVKTIKKDPNPNARNLYACDVDIALLELGLKLKNKVTFIEVEPE